MEPNPLEEWQRLTEAYREMYDEELLNLAAVPEDLTETARQVLRDEIRKRGLDEPRAAGNASGSAERIPPPGWDQGLDESGGEGATRNDGQPVEFTWKALLCECDEQEQAWQIYEMLRRSGIESWIEGPRSRSYAPNPRVVVAADQLDKAREIAARPIPQDIVDESKMTAPEFEPPRCPKCGDTDPVLEDVDPVNAWRCEACGAEWTESAEGRDPETEAPGR
jgi:ribosomal protein L37AE/L43A